MRGFSPPINIVLTVLAAAGIIPVLGLPWFAGSIDSNDGNQGSVELMGEAIGRWFTQQGSTSTGADVLTNSETVLLAVCAASALLALLMLLPPLRPHLRDLVKMVPLAAPLVVVVQIISQAHAAAVEPRYGGFVALALTAFMASAANQAAEMREPKPAQRQYTPGAGRAF